MKTRILTALALIWSSLAFAQVDVTFRVDMSNETVDTAGVHLAGDLQDEAGAAGDWLPDATPLTDMGNGIWSVTLNIPAGSYEYKFLNGNTWGTDENMSGKPCEIGGGNTNRPITVSATDTVTYCFNSCTTCDIAQVLFQVDMSTQTVSANGVHIAGSFQGELGGTDWTPDSHMMTDDDGDMIYELLVELPADTYEWKYLNGNAWGDDEVLGGSPCANGSGNREITVAGGESTTTMAYCFGTCNTCVLPTAVTLTVDMSNETASGDGVHVAGSFQGWDPAATPLTDNGDGTWSVTLDIQPGDYEYKFVNGNAWGSDESIPSACQVNGNRGITVTANDTAVAYCFNQCTEDCVVDPPAANVTFYVDMTGLTVESSGVWVMGSYSTPAWQDGRTQMTPNGDHPDVYEVTINIAGPADFMYKFSNGEPASGTQFENGEEANLDSLGCGAPNGIGGFNRTFTRTGANESPGVFCYNTCDNCNNVPLSIELAAAQANSISIYPNPMSSYAVVEVPEAFGYNYTFTVYNATGQAVVRKANQSKRNLIVAKSELSQGVYLVEVLGQNGVRTVQRMVVK